MTTKPGELGPPRWRGQPHRLEVWYATFTDLRTTDGYWLHHEVVAPDEGAAYAHGWSAVFPFDGPRSSRALRSRCRPTRAATRGSRRRARMSTERHSAAPRATWRGTSPTPTRRRRCTRSRRGRGRRRCSPRRRSCRSPTARFAGTVSIAGRTVELDDAVGARRPHLRPRQRRAVGLAARRPRRRRRARGGRGRARRKRGPVAIPPVPLVQLRLDGDDWPDDSVKAAARARAKVALPHWSVKVVSGHRRLLADVTVPGERVGDAGLHRSRRCHRDVHEQRAGRRRDRVAALGRRLARRPRGGRCAARPTPRWAFEALERRASVSRPGCRASCECCWSPRRR